MLCKIKYLVENNIMQPKRMELQRAETFETDVNVSPNQFFIFADRDNQNALH